MPLHAAHAIPLKLNEPNLLNAADETLEDKKGLGALTDLDLTLPEYHPLDLADHPVDGLREPAADAHVGLRVERERRRRRGGVQQPLHGYLRRRSLQRPDGPTVPGRIRTVILNPKQHG